MKKIVLIVTFGLFIFQLLAQNIELKILPNSIKVKNDSLYFKYKIQNKSDTVFVLYNIGIVGVELDPKLTEKDLPFRVPHLSALIYDTNGNLPSQMWVSHSSNWPPNDVPEKRTQTYEDSIYTNYYGKYLVLPKDKAVEYYRRIYIGNIGLKKGTYTFQLGYSSTSSPDYYNRKYKKAKEKDSRLKNSVMFEGEIKSNECKFEYP